MILQVRKADMEVHDLRILFVISKMGKGGAQRIVLDLANAMAASGARVDLLIFYRTEQDQSILEDLNPHVNLLDVFPVALASDHENSPKKIFVFLSLPFLAFWWTISGKMANYHIVHANLMLASFFTFFCSIFRFLGRMPFPKYIETFHGDLISLLPWERNLFFVFWKMTDSLVVELRRKDLEILQKRMPGHYIQYIPFGVAPLGTPEQKEIIEYKKSHNNVPVILSVMRLQQHQKKVLDLLMVINQFRSMYDKPFLYVLVGDGPDRQRAEAYVRSAGLDEYVIFTGYMNDINLFCAAARVFLIAGVEDLVGIAALQAATLGVPIVSLQMDVQWNNVEPIFFNSTSHEILSQELKKLIVDDAYYQNASNYATDIVRNIFSVEQMVASYKEVYISLAEKK